MMQEMRSRQMINMRCIFQYKHTLISRVWWKDCGRKLSHKPSAVNTKLPSSNSPAFTKNTQWVHWSELKEEFTWVETCLSHHHVLEIQHHTRSSMKISQINLYVLGSQVYLQWWLGAGGADYSYISSSMISWERHKSGHLQWKYS